MESSEIRDIIIRTSIKKDLQYIAEKILHDERISCDDALVLYEKADLNLVGMLANYVKTKNFGNQVFFNKNIHIEPSNVCIHKCKFCSYYREKDDKETGCCKKDSCKEVNDIKENCNTEEVYYNKKSSSV